MTREQANVEVSHLDTIEVRLTVLTWMVAANIVLSLAILLELG